jgi:hypothetical protein
VEEAMTEEEFAKRLAKVRSAWPFDEAKPMTDAQLKERGAIDWTSNDLGVVVLRTVEQTPALIEESTSTCPGSPHTLPKANSAQISDESAMSRQSVGDHP